MEKEWLTPYSDKWEIAMEGIFYLIAFFCALGGEEIPLADLDLRVKQGRIITCCVEWMLLVMG